jgi:hypothetical protein
MKDKSGNRSLLSNGVARTHFMPPDGACILTVLKPLQSLTGGSRLDALQNRRLTNRRAINTLPANAMIRTDNRRYLYLRIRIYAISYTSHFPNKIFCRHEPCHRNQA